MRFGLWGGLPARGGLEVRPDCAGYKPARGLQARPTMLLLILSFIPALHANTFYLTIAGLGGEPEYDQRFTGWAKDIEKLLKAAEPNAKVETLMGNGATKASIQQKLGEFAQQAKPDDSVVIMLIGHGSYDESDYKFNIPGPDLSATELANLLDKIPSKHQLVVNMTSASGGSIVSLSKPGRVVITATKTGTEKNATYFARYWVEALRDPAADTDKNEIITALEAFKYAEAKTAGFFQTNNRIATEHALIDDAGKGEGVKAPSPENGQGQFAGRFALVHLGKVSAQINDPEKLKLLKKKEELEAAIDDLKYKKASMDLNDYRRQLSQLLVQLAQTQEALDK